MLALNCCHHIALICSDLEKSKIFYTSILGFVITNEQYRTDSESCKVDLALNGNYLIELFSFPNPPKRLSHPEGTGLRHIAFEVANFDDSLQILNKKEVFFEQIRIDKATNKRFTYIFDPDNLPIELYEH